MMEIVKHQLEEGRLDTDETAARKVAEETSLISEGAISLSIQS